MVHRSEHSKMYRSDTVGFGQYVRQEQLSKAHAYREFKKSSEDVRHIFKCSINMHGPVSTSWELVTGRDLRYGYGYGHAVNTVLLVAKGSSLLSRISTLSLLIYLLFYWGFPENTFVVLVVV